MSATQDSPPGQLPALVSRRGDRADQADSYLVLGADGQLTWTGDPQCATAFASMREAARMAFRLPASLRAYGLPLSIEVSSCPR